MTIENVEPDEIVPFRCSVCQIEIAHPPSLPFVGKIHICSKCRQVTCFRHRAKIDGEIYCSKCSQEMR
jgi:hypothetical protein